MNDIPRTRLYRLLEIFPGALSWTIILGPIIVSVWFPRAVAIFMTLYVVLWFLRLLKLSAFLIYAHARNKKFEKENWLALLKFFSDHPGEAKTNLERKIEERVRLLREEKKYIPWTDIHHIVIIATFREEQEILESTVESLTHAEFPIDRMTVVLATEQRDRERAERNVAYLEKKFAKQFGGFYSFMHPSNIPGEIIGKGPNITYAGRNIARIMAEKRIAPHHIVVTTLDADNRPHPKYFANLTYHYLMESNRKERSYQPVPFFYNNIWDVPLWNRLVALASSFWQLEQSVEVDSLRNFSSHAQSLEALLETDFWSRQTIDEDGHQFWRSYFTFRGRHKVIPLFIPIYQDAVQNRTYFLTLKSQYIQIRRWAWGCTDIPYAILKMWKDRRHLPFWRSCSVLFQLIEGHIMWSTAPIVITFTNVVPWFVNRSFAQTVFAYNLNQAFSTIFTVALIGILISIWISLLTLPPHPRGKKWVFLSLFQWIGLPLVTVLFGAFPALDSQTRLMLNRPLEFTVTEKIRKVS